jgi:hypothetical protein
MRHASSGFLKQQAAVWSSRIDPPTTNGHSQLLIVRDGIVTEHRKLEAALAMLGCMTSRRRAAGFAKHRANIFEEIHSMIRTDSRYRHRNRLGLPVDRDVQTRTAIGSSSYQPRAIDMEYRVVSAVLGDTCQVETVCIGGTLNAWFRD